MALLRARQIAAVLAALAACDAQAPSDYQGEPLFTVQGQVASSGTLPPLEAAMLWQRGAPPDNSDQELATRAPVQSGFPARFTVHLYQPAPGAARHTLAAGEPVYARAAAAAVPLGVSQNQLGGVATANNPQYGIDPDHWVLYLASDVPPGSLTEWWLGAALPAGFHLMTVAPRCLQGADLDACVATLVARGLTDDHTASPGTARYFCTQPYALAPAQAGEQLLLQLGSVGLAPGAACP